MWEGQSELGSGVVPLGVGRETLSKVERKNNYF